jgi:DNA-binding GntR family transcriptional regulator
VASGSFAPIQQDSLAELAYQAIWDGIVEGRFAMGERLVETSLAVDLGISRGPIREALRRLYEDGLVEQVPRRGTYVKNFDAHDLIDIYNLRLAIEAAAATLVVRKRVPLESLQRIVDVMRAAALDGDFASVVEQEYEFHREMCRLAGNPYLLATFMGLAAKIRLALTLDNRSFPNLLEVVSEHSTLLDALRRGDEVHASRETQSHIVSTITVIINAHGIDTAELLAPPVSD